MRKPAVAAYLTQRIIRTASSLKMVLTGMTGSILSRRDILEAADVVDERAVVGIVVEGVEGEVAAVRVLVDGAELVADRAVGYGPEGGDLEDLRPAIDVHEAEAPAR